MNDNLLRYIGIWSPTVIVGLLTAVFGAAVIYTGFTRRNSTKFNVLFTVIMIMCGALLCIGVIPREVLFYSDGHKPLRLMLNTLCMPVFTVGGIGVIIYSMLHIFLKTRPNIYGDIILKSTSVISGAVTELLALIMIVFGINGFINYMNI